MGPENSVLLCVPYSQPLLFLHVLLSCIWQNCPVAGEEVNITQDYELWSLALSLGDLLSCLCPQALLYRPRLEAIHT